MSGYTPLFDVTGGTLAGRWPDTGLWCVVLSLADMHGVVDRTHEYISLVSGLELSEVRACMQRFCEPDPRSRSQECEGRRLIPIDPSRDWGWKIVNHARYRERARLMAKNARETEERRRRRARS